MAKLYSYRLHWQKTKMSLVGRGCIKGVIHSVQTVLRYFKKRIEQPIWWLTTCLRNAIYRRHYPLTRPQPAKIGDPWPAYLLYDSHWYSWSRPIAVSDTDTAIASMAAKYERLSGPRWLTYSGWFTHINGHPSATGRPQDSESTPAKDYMSVALQ